MTASRPMLGVCPALVARLAVSAAVLCGVQPHLVASQAPAADGVPTPATPPDAVALEVPAIGTDGLPRPVVSTSRVFASEAGLVLTPVKPAKVGDFEMVIARLHEALSMSADPLRREQAGGWKVYRASEPGPGGSVLFVYLMSPAVKGADYTMGKILLEAFPQDEVLEIFEAYTDALAGPQSLVSIRLVEDFSGPPLPRVPDR